MNLIKQLRGDSGMTQSEFAEKLGVSQAHVSLIEGNIKKASPKLLEKAASVLGCDISVFVEKTAFRDRQLATILSRLKDLDDETVSAISLLILGLRNGRNSSARDEIEDQG